MAGMLASFTMANSKGLYPKLSGGPRRAKRTKKKRAAVARSNTRRGKRVTKRPARLVKGSAAAKAYMAKIRRKRRR
jgi:hypothetical protein